VNHDPVPPILVALVSTAGIVLFLGLAEALDAKWLYVPGIVCFFTAIGCTYVARFGFDAIAFMAASLTVLVVLGFVVELVD
jgi:hypothetical protein